MAYILDPKIEHLLRRAGFGARQDELDVYRAESFSGALTRLLEYERVERGDVDRLGVCAGEREARSRKRRDEHASLLVARGGPLEADPDPAASRERTQRWLALAPALPVVTGFLAGDDDKGLVLLGRGGSDVSATLLGSALEAKRVEIWTDTPGVLTADPRLEPAARVHSGLSAREAARLARLGARVLHPRTLELAHGIPVLVRDTFAPEAPGTRIAADERARDATIVSGSGLVRLASDAGADAVRLAAVLRAHELPALLSPIDDSLLVPQSAVGSVRALGLHALRFAPGPHGAHLVTAWGIVRDRQLFSPWFERRAANVVARDGALARVIVRNPGAAIPPEVQGRMFDRFWRGESSRAKSGDRFGLGLAIVRAIARMHGGDTQVHCEGGFTDIGFTLKA